LSEVRLSEVGLSEFRYRFVVPKTRILKSRQFEMWSTSENLRSLRFRQPFSFDISVPLVKKYMDAIEMPNRVDPLSGAPAWCTVSEQHVGSSGFDRRLPAARWPVPSGRWPKAGGMRRHGRRDATAVHVVRTAAAAVDGQSGLDGGLWPAGRPA